MIFPVFHYYLLAYLLILHIAKFDKMCYTYLVMEKRIHLYVSRKNVLTWLMVLCMVGSAVARIAIPCVKGTWGELEVWSQIVLPIAATLLYVFIILLRGDEMFYKTAIPVWMMGLYFAIQPHIFIGTSPFLLGMFYTCIVFYCVAYTAITSGKVRFPWLLIFLLLAPLASIGYVARQIAAMGDAHFSVRKAVRDGRTSTDVLLLDEEGRAGELARITGGFRITETLIAGAKEQLRAAEEYKKPAKEGK